MGAVGVMAQRKAPVQPWERVMERTLLKNTSPDWAHRKVARSKYQVYRHLGWTEGEAYSKRKLRHLRLDEMAMIAQAIGMTVAQYCNKTWNESLREAAQERRVLAGTTSTGRPRRMPKPRRR